MENSRDSLNGDETKDQLKTPLAVVKGSPLTQLPLDLYVPPDALEVILEAFEGPLDLLLYLIKKQNLHILDIEVAQITDQYMQYIDLMQEMKFELAAEYLVMAASLAEIKSRMLLPRQVLAEDEEKDPRMDLVRRLQEYERYKNAAMEIDMLDRENRDFWSGRAKLSLVAEPAKLPEVDLRDLVLEFSEVIKRAELYARHSVEFEVLSTRERMINILRTLEKKPYEFISFRSFFNSEEGRRGVVVTFMAIMELMKEGMLETVQNEQFAPIYLKLA